MFETDDYKVWFRHDTERKENVPYLPEFKGITVCSILRKADNYVIQGIAFCSVKDKFNRADGRKVSLTKALKHLDKETRTMLWNEYFTRSKKDHA